MKTAAAYIRVSDERQDEYSPESQLKLIQDFAKRSEYIIPQEYIYYDDGISARSTKKRDQFNEMIAAAKSAERPFEAILVWKFSRFARNQEQSIVFKSLLKKNNVDVISVSEPISDNPFGSLIERIIEWMDEYYLIRLSGEVKRGMTEKASRGEAMCHPAFGYDLKDKKYYPNEYAEYIKMIFNDFKNGVGMRTIAQKLNSMGIKTTRGNTFDNRHIEYILNNPVYNGKIRWSTDGKAASARDYNNPNIMIVDGKHEKIIDDELWNSVQQQLEKQSKMYRKYQRKNKKADWMLKGLVRCSSCGSTLILSSAACPSMQCHKYARGQCKVSHSLSLAKADRTVIQGMQTALEDMNFSIIPKTAKNNSSNIDYDKLIQIEEKKLERCKEAYTAGIDSLEEYKSNKEKINKNMEKLYAEKAEKQPQITVDLTDCTEKVNDLLEAIESDNITENVKNEMLRTIIAYIIYRKQTKSMEIFFYA